MQNLTIRSAIPADAARLLELYAPYVAQTAVSLELEVPSLSEFRQRIETTLRKFPYLVAEADGVILGYTYAGCFRVRAGYARSCEVSLYVAMEAHGCGIGRSLYTALEARLADMGIRNLYACIAFPVCPDEYLDTNSRDFHAHMGYETVGHFHRCSRKFGRIYDMIYMEKQIGPADEETPLTDGDCLLCGNAL